VGRRPVYINWGLSSFYGWGVYGLNLALNWMADPDLAPVATNPIEPRALAIDPLRMRALEDLRRRSAAFQDQLAGFAGGPAALDAVLLADCNAQFQRSPAAHGVTLSGQPTVAVTFFETARLEPEAVSRAADYPLIVTGSTWNREVLQAHGLSQVRTVLQGVDPTVFHPAPSIRYLPDRFLVFSGGKLERRKGQDLVMAAFRRFAERRADALLVTAWHSPWPEAARTLDAGGLTAPIPFDVAGRADVVGWAAANGVGRENILDLGLIPNEQTPSVLREMDVAVFPNRAEGGTNLVAMECMACGVPVILSANTGHLDLIEDENAYPLTQQRELPGAEAGFKGVAGWGESDVDEIAALLERAYAQRDEARARGLRGAATLSRLTWADTARRMKALIRPLDSKAS